MKKVQYRVLMMAFLGFLFISASASFAQTKVLTLSGTDAMQFDTKEFKVKAGQKIKLTFKHAGKYAKQAMGHNFVLLKSGTDIADFASKANLARDNDYIPKSEASKIIAHTKLLGGGESDTIEFTAPKKGVYPYICSFPGHYGLMQGKFIVE
ncbi:azurin [Larkinella terrae]|uniref:Azurin n=1 Tax=Larkinella terrae TaxID=2025311 RepID=A0A7K0EL65_9BACT|nr:azurin [Larkinella terrae]MRS62281.1 azurin [Larkinella terrae]